MYSFEVMGDDGLRHLHFERWREHQQQLFESYPVPQGKTRIELELHHPRNSLAELPVDLETPEWFPIYSDPAWSTVFEVCELEHSVGGYLWMFVEDGHDNPWGESIRLMSTSSEITDDHANRIAFFRGQYWSVFNPTFYRPPLVYRHSSVNYVHTFNHTTLYEALALMTYDMELNFYRKSKPKHKVDWGRDGF